MIKQWAIIWYANVCTNVCTACVSLIVYHLIMLISILGISCLKWPLEEARLSRPSDVHDKLINHCDLPYRCQRLHM